MSASPLVSFVVLSYNYARFIDDTLRSILNQRGQYDFEVIVVDDASTDNSHEVISAFTDPRITYIRHERNQGHAATVTDGLRAARGKYVARIDSDDRYRPEFLERVIPILEANERIRLVCGDAAIIDDEGVQTAARTDTRHRGRDFTGNAYVELLACNFICAPTVIAPREGWLKALPIPDGLSFHDWWFTLQIARTGDVHFDAHVLADYRVHHSNYHSLITRNRTEESSIRRLLGQLFSEREPSEKLEAEKQGARRRIFGEHYRLLALKYFGAGMTADARRCYLEAMRHQPKLLTDPEVMRHLLGTVIGMRGYHRLKELLGDA